MGTPEDGRVILVGVDGSATSDAALRWTLRALARPGDQVKAIIVVPDEGLLPGTSFAFQPHGRGPTQLRDYSPADHVERLRAAVPGSAPVAVTTAQGDAATELVTASAHADLLVIGAHGGSATSELLLGSVSRECIRYARCPVTVITGEAAARV
ncbi:universal stress protein [Amycolatopsis magusensis]|uniref:Nucleotide-binding universal stress UspA family protein n=1 Tax=Amycolatopsis magusensis TaxID=882444 RepID=A0ABS4PW90_9PSEU|nr:universal stress protein [Amycolatopsis magusensis]MBP2183697.1 nucleotide-binding universal stress UspA family protein [Amycolatopsis magusensis]